MRRYLLAYSLVLGFGGLPLIYMGDELALRNYYDFVEDPEQADDNRWVHRPPMPWDLVDNRHIDGTVEYRVWHGLRHVIAVRSSLPSLDASVESEILDPVNPAVLVFPAPVPDSDDDRCLQRDDRAAAAAALGHSVGQLGMAMRSLRRLR